CKQLYHQYQIEFILQEEETFEPAQDDDASTSLFDSGMKLLTQMDRVTAIEGLIAYNKMRDEIREFLQPFAASGKTVTKQDIESFIQTKLEQRKSPPNNENFF
ncbi:9335_t:CDS:2, partial [Ambispora leptoticha]